MKIRDEIVVQDPIRAFALLDGNEALYVSNKEFYQIDLKTKTSVLLMSLPKEVCASRDIGISLSCNKRFIAVYGVHGSQGFIYDRNASSVTLPLDRGKYHTWAYSFSIAFFEQDNRQLLVHATTWNMVHITDLETGELLTKRDLAESKEGINFFHSLLHISPGNEWIVSNGWVWAPGAFLRIWNLQNWLLRNPFEPEDNKQAFEHIGCYSWDRPLFWLNEHEFAHYFHPNDCYCDEDDIDTDWWLEGMKKGKGCILVYDIPKRKHVRCILFDGFEANSDWECDKAAKLFYHNGNIISSCPTRGVQITAASTGTELQTFPDLQLNDFHEPTGSFIALKDNKVTLYELELATNTVANP